MLNHHFINEFVAKLMITEQKMKKGFTLIELVVVIIILGILAGLAIPSYRKTVERSRIAEAHQILGALRNAAFRYYNENMTWTMTISETDFDAPGWDGSDPYNGKYFSYVLLNPETTPADPTVAYASRFTNVDNPGYDYNVFILLGGDFVVNGDDPPN